MSRKGLALVTGASAGIGRELALVFAGHGHDLVLVARMAEKLEALAREVWEKHGHRAEVIVQWLRLQPRWFVRTFTGFLSRRYAQGGPGAS